MPEGPGAWRAKSCINKEGGSWYHAVAFAFMFSYCTGMPDYMAFQETERYRRVDNAPRVEHPIWDRIMARRAEGQMVRDWQMGFLDGIVMDT